MASNVGMNRYGEVIKDNTETATTGMLLVAGHNSINL
jgi:hypothetical protein